MLTNDTRPVSKGRPVSASIRKPVSTEVVAPVSINIQNFVDKKLQISKRVAVPAHSKFPNAENDANNWSVSVMAKYLNDVLELPQYTETFKRHEIDGQKFLSRNESSFNSIDITDKFHIVKLTSHAEQLRNLVLERAHIERPDSALDWSVAHVAAWLTYDKSCPETAILGIKAKLNGFKMKELTGKQAVLSIGASHLDEAASATIALDSLSQSVRDAFLREEETKIQPETTTSDIVNSDGHNAATSSEVCATDGAKTKKKTKKAKTAIQRRREEEQEREEKEKKVKVVKDDSDDDGSELHVLRNDSLPAPATNTSAHQAYNSAMSNLFSDLGRTLAGAKDAKPESVNVQNDIRSGGAKYALHTIDENAYGKVRDVTAEVSAEERRALPEDLPPDEGDMELPADVDVFKMGGYKKSKERKKFLSKITNLRKIVADHAQTMEDLREQAHILKNENRLIKQQQKLLLQEGGASQELIATLVKDRNVALAELEKVSSLYSEHTSREREEIVRDLQLLTKDTLQAKSETKEMQRHHSQQMELIGNLEVRGALTSPPQPVAAKRSQKKASRRQQTEESGSSGSDLDDEYERRAPPRPESAARSSHEAPPFVSSVHTPQNDTVLPLLDHQPSVPAVAVIISTTPTPLNATAPSAINRGASHPLAAARTLLASTIATTSSSPSLAAATASTDLVRLMDQTADDTLALWQAILRTYRVPRAAHVEHFSDSKLILRHLSVPWQRLGHQMLEDAHSSETEKGLRKALKGLEKCAKKAVIGVTRAAKRSLEGHVSASKPAQRTSQAQSDGKRGHRGEPGSTAFPESEAQATWLPDETIGSLGVGGGAEEVNCHHTAAGMVFGLALVSRIMSRYSSTQGGDKAQLLFLLNAVNHGDLPATEISRDNMRDFLDSHVGIDLKWDKFDSVCQKLDPDRNGFISTPSVISAFAQLAPLSDRIFTAGSSSSATASSGNVSAIDPDRAELLFLSIATTTMAKPKQPINEAFMSLILHNSKSSASFAKYLLKEQERVASEDQGYVLDPISPRSMKISADARVADLQLFVADIFYELTKEFIYKAEAAPDLSNKHLPKSSKMDLQNSQKQFSVQKKHVSFLVKQHQEVCAAVAKGVQVYEGSSRKALVNHLSTFMLTFLSFRRIVVLGLIEQAYTSSGRNLFGTTANLASSTSLAAAQNSDGKLSEAQLRQVLQGIETNIATLTGQYDPREENDPASDTYSPLKPKSLGPIGIKLAPDPLTLQEYDQIIAELLGIPVPRYMCKCGEGDCCSGLAQLQGQVETILFHISEHFALEESLMVVAPEPPKPLASSLSLKDLQQTLFRELWEGKPPAESSADDTVNTTEVGEGTVSPTKSLRRQLEGPPIHVVEEVNDLMHKQRVEQVSHYLEILNEKAVKRKKMIRGLMNLWQSAKMVIEDHNKISKFASAAEIEQKRLLAMPVEDILAQTRSMQTQLVREMEEKSSTKLSQLSQRINLLRQGIASQSIPDEDLAVTATLREVSALENALLQANSDAMRLAARIIKQLSDKKVGAGVTL